MDRGRNYPLPGGGPAGARGWMTALVGRRNRLSGSDFSPLVSADPTSGHDAKVNTQTPRTLRDIGSADVAEQVSFIHVCPVAGDDQVRRRGQGLELTIAGGDPKSR
jgi:hypothetical protein